MGADRPASVLFYVLVSLPWFFAVPVETRFLDVNHFLSQSQQHMEADRGRASGVSVPLRLWKCLSL